MKKDKVTCIDNVRFIFEFFEKREYSLGEEPPLKDIIDKDKITYDAVRNLGSFLSKRLSKIADMMAVLQSIHHQWLITGKKDRVIMETETFDFNDAIKALKDKGFNDDEYILKIEYERKWGTL